jgi:hypothetical protein
VLPLFDATSPSDQSGLAGIFGRLGRELTGVQSVDEVLQLISTRAYEVIPSAEHAAITRGRNGSFETVATTSDVPPRVDQLQYRLGAGPCVDAALKGGVYRTGDLRYDETWPDFGTRAARECGIHSMLSVRLYLESVEEDGDIVALNLYSSAIDAFDDSDQTTATLLATHGALGFTAARRRVKIENLERALHTSRRIGSAIGILMVSYKTTEQQAFDLLRIASQSTHRKLADIAEDVLLTGALDVPASPEQRSRDEG